MPNKLERLCQMEDLINRGRYPTVDDFCRRFEVRARTVYDDIRYLREERGLEIEFDRFRNGYYNKNPKKQLPEFDLNAGEIFALTLGNDMLAEYAGTSFEPVLRSALDKIYHRLPDRVKIPAEEVHSMVKFNAGPVVHISRKQFLDMNRACEKNLPVEITYFAAKKGETTSRKVHPYRLLQNSGAWYMVAWCTMRRDLRLFALNRIRNYELCDERFTPQENLDIDHWVESAFQLEHGGEQHRVSVLFQPLAARYIQERIWHPKQVLTNHEDGSCTLEFETLSLDEAKRWVLTYGSEAEVLAPKALRDLVREEMTRAIAVYG